MKGTQHPFSKQKLLDAKFTKKILSDSIKLGNFLKSNNYNNDSVRLENKNKNSKREKYTKNHLLRFKNWST